MPDTLLLLDVDGVVVPAVDANVAPAADEASYRIAVPPWVPGHVHIRPAVLEAVKRWAVSGAEVQWLSSWGGRTRWLDQVGLPYLPVFYEPGYGEVADWGRSQRPWKRPAVERFLAARTDSIRLAWIDDDAFFSRGKHMQSYWLDADPILADLLLVEPDCFVGLQDHEIARVDKFLVSSGTPTR
ncbi:HAD domain-containing protein [Arthrobacter sp. MDT1-65]